MLIAKVGAARSVGFLAVAYWVGLLGWGAWPLQGLPWHGAETVLGLLARMGIGVGMGAIAAVAIAPRWRTGPSPRLWLAMGLATAIAILNLTLRAPHPGPQDISHFLPRAQAIGGMQRVEGRLILSDPQLTRRLRGRFFLQVSQLANLDKDGAITFQTPVTGRVYVTAPLLQVAGLHPGQSLQVTGRLYGPTPALNPNGFDFQQFLRQRHTFAGLAAETIQPLTPPPPWGLWRLRQPIVQAHLQGLGSPWGQLVSAMALGRQAVDLPFDLRDLFSQAGLAHTIAASGFHVSLLLGAVLALVPPGLVALRRWLGWGVLVAYVGLVGIQASVVRAAIMGAIALDALARDRRVNPIQTLLLATTLMLLVNPHWIWDIGFQLSALATLGLLVTVTPLVARLPWLPPTLATGIAVPVAANLWVFPLVIYHFNTLSVVSLLLNALVTPLVMVVSLGGMVTGAIALGLSPLAPWGATLASTLASLLGYPLQGLYHLARLSTHLPGSALAMGQISLWQMAAFYGSLLWWRGDRPRRQRWGVAIALGLLVALPWLQHLLTPARSTLLAAGGDLIWLHQHQGQTTLLTTAREDTLRYTLLPFLRQAGVNHLDHAIGPTLPVGVAKPAPGAEPGTELGAEPGTDLRTPLPWSALLTAIPLGHSYGPHPTSPWGDQSWAPQHYTPLPLGQTTTIAPLSLQRLGSDYPILRLTTPDQGWLFLPALPPEIQTFLAQGAATSLPSQVLVWPGTDLSDALLDQVRPQVALCHGRTLSPAVEAHLQGRGIPVYWPERDGAVTWRRGRGFQSYRQRPLQSRPWE